jgi:nitrogen fixation protein NifX
MKIAFATQDKQRVDAHFGWAPHIAVYDIDKLGYRYVETFDFGAEDEDGNEDKLTAKLDVLDDVAIIYVAAIGGSAAARVVARKVHPVKLPTAELILDVLDRLQIVLGGTPPPWLRKALMRDQPQPDFDDETL